jgi:hypothetical protein
MSGVIAGPPGAEARRTCSNVGGLQPGSREGVSPVSVAGTGTPVQAFARQAICTTLELNPERPTLSNWHQNGTAVVTDE